MTYYSRLGIVAFWFSFAVCSLVSTGYAHSAPDELLATFTGIVHDIDNKNLTIEEADSNTLRFVCSRKTKYYDGSRQIKSSAIKPGDHVSVESRTLPDGAIEAVKVRLEHMKSS